MNEQLQQALADLIIKGTETAEKAGDFLLAEIPDVAQQALLYYGIYYFVKFVAWLALVGITVWIWRLGLRNKEGGYGFLRHQTGTDKGRLDEDIITPVIGATIILHVAPMLLLMNLTWLKIWIAPKLWLIEYAGSLVR